MFEKLDWKSRDDGVIYAEPHGLKYSYFIYPPNEENHNYELAFIEDNGNYINNVFVSLKQEVVKDFVEQHKNDILFQHMGRRSEYFY